MGTFSSLTPLFEKPISESTPSIFGSLVKSRSCQAPEEQPAFTEIFGELHFKESPPAPSLGTRESLQLCTEGLGFESSDDTEVAGGELGEGREERGVGGGGGRWGRMGRWCGGRASFPPPIPSIGGSGKPSIAFQAFKGEGRFVLREVRVPTQELFLRPCREGGRLMLRLVQSDDEGDGSDDGVGDVEEEERGEE